MALARLVRSARTSMLHGIFVDADGAVAVEAEEEIVVS